MYLYQLLDEMVYFKRFLYTTGIFYSSTAFFIPANLNVPVDVHYLEADWRE